MNKRGFTLVEIIVVISLLAVIGVGITFAIIKTNEKKRQMELEILVANQDKFQSALEVYLSNHKEIETKVKKDYNGAVISLEVLKNEGLISDNMAIDYKDNYYVVSYSLLTNEELEEYEIKSNCDNNVALSLLPSWIAENSKGYETAKVYFCPNFEKEECKCEGCEEKEDEELDCTSFGIEDPYVACDNILGSESLACKVLSSAHNERFSDDGTFLEEDQLDKNFLDNFSRTLLLFEDEKSFNEILNIDSSYELTYAYTPNKRETFLSYSYFVSGTKYKLYDTVSFDNKTGTYTLGNNYYEFELRKFIDSYGKLYELCTRLCKTSDGGICDKNGVNFCVKNGPQLNNYVFVGHQEEYFRSDAYGDYSNIKYELDRTFGSNNIYLSLNGSIYEFKTSGIKYNDNGNLNISAYKLSSQLYKERTLKDIKDDYGISYYFRGDVNDNYVKFAEMCWRIVRVQGDGSVKLILSDKDGNCNGNSSKVNIVENNNNLFVYYGSVSRSDYHTYPQYDYGHGCWYTSWGDNHLSGDDGVRYADSINGSSLRNHLESFIDKFSSEQKNKLKKVSTCLGVKKETYNDWKSIYANAKSDNNIFSRTKLSETNDLSCDDKIKVTPSYISTITVDEAYLSGLNTEENSNSYLSSINSKFYTISPSHIQFNIAWNGSTCSDSAIANKTCASYFVEMQNYVYTIDSGKISKTYSGPKCNSIAQDINAVPTIVLKANSIVSGGNGTKDNPYNIRVESE